MRYRCVPRILVIGLALAALAGCGGGSSTGASGSGGGSGAVVQGQVRTTRSAAAGAPVIVVVLQKALGIGVAEAQNGEVPLAGAEVTIACDTGYNATTTTDANGNFVFQNVPPGTCTITVEGDPLTATPIVVGDGDTATIAGKVTKDEATGTVTVAARDVSLQNDAQLGHAINIDRASDSCDLAGVVSLREAGLGWGVIARECDVHPGVIGLGRSNVSDGEIADASERVAKARGTGGGKKGKGGRGRGRGKGA